MVWFKQLRAFPTKYSCVVFDNRSVGLSDKPDEPYSISLFVEDLMELLDFLEAEKTILGFSMGGLAAQEFALKYPGRAAGLVLVSMHPGGERALQIPENVVKVILSEWKDELGVEEALTKKLSLMFNPEHMEEHPEEISQIIFWILDN